MIAKVVIRKVGCRDHYAHGTYIATSWITVAVTQKTTRLVADKTVRQEVFGLLGGLSIELLPHALSSRKVHKRFSGIGVGDHIEVKGNLMIEQGLESQLQMSLGIHRMKRIRAATLDQKDSDKDSESATDQEDGDNMDKSSDESNTKASTPEADDSDDQASSNSGNLSDEKTSVYPGKIVPRKRRSHEICHSDASSLQHSFSSPLLQFPHGGVPPLLSTSSSTPTMTRPTVLRDYHMFDGYGYRKGLGSVPPLRYPTDAEELFVFVQRFSDGRRRSLQIMTNSQEHEGVDTLIVHEHWTEAYER